MVDLKERLTAGDLHGVVEIGTTTTVSSPPAAARARRRARLAVVAGTMAIAAATFAFRWMSLEKFSNDHFDHVARAYQVLLGEWPVRDFVDPGLPLAYLLSAAIHAIVGKPFLAETLLFAAGFALAAAISFRVATMLSGSVLAALVAVTLQVATYPRSYSYPKLLVYALAAAAAWWTLHRSSRSDSEERFGRLRDPAMLRFLPLAAATAIAYYFRHDHGVYVALGAVVLLSIQLWQRGVGHLMRASATYLALTLGFVLPHLAYVQWYGGLRSYFAVAQDYSRMEVQINPYQLPVPGLPLTADSSVALLFWVWWLIPLLGAVLLRRGGNIPAVRERKALAAMLITLAVCLNLGMLRDPLIARLPDAVAPHSILGAWLFAELWRWPRHGALLAVNRGLLAASALLVCAAVFTAFETSKHLERARVSGGPAAMLQRWNDVFDELSDERPGVMPGVPHGLEPFLAYVAQCTSPSDRLVYVGYEPQLFVLTRRGFGGGHMMFLGAFHSAPAEQLLTVHRLANADVPFVLLPSGSRESFPRIFPSVWSYVQGRYVRLASLEVENGRLDVMVDTKWRAKASTDPATGWPCLAEPRSRPL